MSAFGWALFIAILIALGFVLLAVYVKRSRAAKVLYFICIITIPIAAVVAGGVAAVNAGGWPAEANEKSFLEGYTAVMVAGGTLIQVLLDTSWRGKKPLIGTFETVEVLRAPIASSKDTNTNTDKTSTATETDEPSTVTITVGDNDVRETMRASGWALILVGAISGGIAVFL